MTKTLLAIGAAAVALTGVATSTAADAKHHSRTCSKWRNHHCVNYGYGRHAQWNTGYRFGPRYSYTSYRALPRVYVQRYSLSPNYRYVYRDNYIYQVDPTTYAITRVINALTR
jgi:nucleoside-specific outer membrane channel protein Tsx